MASITPRSRDKDGNILSYQIEVYRGKDKNGKKLKPFSKMWHVPDGWNSVKKIQKELNRVAAEFENECKNGKVLVNNMTFQEYADHFMEYAKSNRKHRTFARYNELLMRINVEIGNIKLKELTALHLNKFYLSLTKPYANLKNNESLSPQTIMHYHRLIHAILDKALKEDLVYKNVANNATPPVVPKHEADYFSLEEILDIKKFLAFEPLKWKVITNLMIDTGARRGEILGLKWTDINFSDNCILICHNLQYTTERGTYLENSTKNNKNRCVHIAQEVIDLLEQYKKEQHQLGLELGDRWNDTGFCFTQENGNPMNPDSINRWLDKFAKKYNLPHIHPHKFRHTQASLLYSTNENPVTISKRLGHSRVSTTQDIYSHLLPGSDEQASDKIANLLYQNKSTNN